MDLYTIPDLKKAALRGRTEARIHVQIDTLLRKETKDGKPFWEVTVADAEGRMTLRAWSDGQAFSACENLAAGMFIEVEGDFVHNQNFGMDAKRWNCRALSNPERDALLAGPPSLREKQAADFQLIRKEVADLKDPRLKALAELFLSDYGERFQRTAAARQNHHARRGGLVEHVAQMMRLAAAVSEAYPGLNRDLLITGVLFHDSGKLWENALPADGFAMPYYECGELLGHITIGLELINGMWRKLMARPEARAWTLLQPASEDVRLHLLHLVTSHHGELQFGSPVVPKTPEACALHYIDNMDAKLEMLAGAYSQGKAIAPRIYERVWPLPGNPVSPLPAFSESDAAKLRLVDGNGAEPLQASAGLDGSVDGQKTDGTLRPLDGSGASHASDGDPRQIAFPLDGASADGRAMQPGGAQLLLDSAVAARRPRRA